MDNENNIFAKPMYKCAICGNAYETIQERIKCETTCLKKQQEEEKAAAEAKKKAEKDSRYKEVNAALDNAYALLNKYIEDYGSFEYGGKYEGLDIFNMDLFPNKILRHFFF